MDSQKVVKVIEKPLCPKPRVLPPGRVCGNTEPRKPALEESRHHMHPFLRLKQFPHVCAPLQCHPVHICMTPTTVQARSCPLVPRSPHPRPPHTAGNHRSPPLPNFVIGRRLYTWERSLRYRLGLAWFARRP